MTLEDRQELLSKYDWKLFRRVFVQDTIDPKPYKWEQRFITAVIILSTILVLGYDWIKDHPQTPPPHVTCYNNDPPEPLGPARLTGTDRAWDQLVISSTIGIMDGSDELHALYIDTLNPDPNTKETAIFVGEGWDCILATAEKGCIIK